MSESQLLICAHSRCSYKIWETKLQQSTVHIWQTCKGYKLKSWPFGNITLHQGPGLLMVPFLRYEINQLNISFFMICDVKGKLKHDQRTINHMVFHWSGSFYITSHCKGCLRDLPTSVTSTLANRRMLTFIVTSPQLSLHKQTWSNFNFLVLFFCSLLWFII